jgi:uracil-DNA glycosylase
VSASGPEAALAQILIEARACTLCAADLPLGPLPLMRAGAGAPILIISQAPGTKAHESDLSFNDPSGDRLRGWLGIDRDTFYDPDKLALLPMGFCYPGRLPKGGDAPPRPECAPLWHDPIMASLPEIRLTLYVGSYAIRHYLPGYRTMTAAVEDWRTYAPDALPLPHPSWRTNAWERKNPWFTEDVLPMLAKQVALALR